jgi:DNA-binding response OmpR family regulator
MATRILLIDDNHDILEILEIALVYDHFTVKAIDDTRDLITTVESFSPDLIILDYVLSNDNGGEVCHMLKSHLRYKNIPIIISTAYSIKPTALFQYGCDAFIEKPFDLEVLISTIREVLQHNVNHTDEEMAE